MSSHAECCLVGKLPRGSAFLPAMGRSEEAIPYAFEGSVASLALDWDDFHPYYTNSECMKGVPSNFLMKIWHQVSVIETYVCDVCFFYGVFLL